MKKILWFFLFIGVLLGGDRLGGYLLRQKLESSQFRYSRMYTHRAQAEILLIGNSRGLPLYQPAVEEMTGVKSFNISYNGAPAFLLEALVADYLDLYPSPKTAIIEITLAASPNKTLLSGFGAYIPYSERLSQLLQDSLPKDYRADQLSHMYRYNSEVFHRTLYHSNKTDTDWLNKHIMSDATASDVNAKPFPLDIHPTLIASLANMTKALQAKGVMTQLVITPYAPGMQIK